MPTSCGARSRVRGELLKLGINIPEPTVSAICAAKTGDAAQILAMGLSAGHSCNPNSGFQSIS
jgi:hypothetical protein